MRTIMTVVTERAAEKRQAHRGCLPFKRPAFSNGGDRRTEASANWSRRDIWASLYEDTRYPQGGR